MVVLEASAEEAMDSSSDGSAIFLVAFLLRFGSAFELVVLRLTVAFPIEVVLLNKDMSSQ